MGGRGKTLGTSYKQIDMNDYKKRFVIQEIINNGEKMRQEIESKRGGGKNTLILYKKCVCCSNYTIPVNEEYFLCPICGWIDDLYQNINPNSLKGKNSICLNEAKMKYLEISRNM